MNHIVVTYEHGLGTETFGGGQRILIEVVKCLTDLHQVTLVTTGSPGDEISAGLAGQPNLHIAYVRPFRRSWVSGLAVFLAFLWGRLWRCDTVIAFTSEIFWISWLRGWGGFSLSGYLAAPDLDGFGEGSRLQRAKIIRRRLELFLFMLGFKRADKKLAIGQRISNEAVAKFGVCDIEVICPGIDVKRDELRGGINDKLEIIYVGRIEFGQKPLLPLLEALSKTQPYWRRFHIIGQGPNLDDVRMYVKTHIQHEVIFHGRLLLDEASDILASANLAILPSAKESFMLTAYEMVAAGLPIVVNDVADLRQNIGHLSTVHIVGDSESEFERAIKFCANNATPGEELETSAKFVSQNFTWEKLSRGLVGA